MVNTVFGATAILGNALVLVSVWRTPVLHSPSNVLLCSLAVSDFLVGLLSQPFFVARSIALLSGNLNLYCTMHIGAAVTGYIFATASLLTLTSMSLERFLALYLHMRYPSVVTVRRAVSIVVCYWCLVVLLSLVFWYSFHGPLALILVPTLSIPCVFICCWSYWKIFRISRRHRRNIRNNQIQAFHATERQGFPLADFRRHRRSTKSLLYYIAALVLCYVPFIVLVVITLPNDVEDLKISATMQMFITITFLNSSLNPPIYFWRVKELRTAALYTIRDLVGYFSAIKARIPCFS